MLKWLNYPSTGDAMNKSCNEILFGHQVYIVLIHPIACYSSEMILLLKESLEQNPAWCINRYM